MLPKPWEQYIASAARQRADAGLVRVTRESGGLSRAVIERDGRAFVSFAGNDYLGLASHPRVREAAAHAAAAGVGSGASRLISGTRPEHGQLEHALAQARKTQGALVFTTGYHANVGVITALADRDTVIVSDELNHASIIDGCRLSRAEVRVFPHRNYNRAKALMREVVPERRLMLISDTLFSIDGDFADTRRLTELAREHDALLVLDDAHAFGALGEQGRGVLEAHNVAEADVVTGTFSKALGALGGYATCTAAIREHLLNTARPFIFSTAATTCDIAAAIAAMEVAFSDEGKSLRHKLAASAARARNGVRALGFHTGGDAHIVPLWLGEARSAVELSAQLEARGVLVPAIRPPTVPQGRAMLRISVSTAHEDAHIDLLLRALSDARSL